MLLERLEAVLNRNVAESRRAQALARQLDGRVMSLTVEGTPLAFYFRAEGGRLSLASSHAGPADASLSGTPIALLALAGPGAEGALRGGGRQVANIARGFLDWGRKASGSLTTNVVEFLQEEGRDVPTRVEAEEFLEGVDRLRDDADRLEARLARLEATGRATTK